MGERDKNHPSRNYCTLMCGSQWNPIGMSSNLILAGSWTIQRLLRNTKFLLEGVSQVTNNVRMHALATPSLGH